VAALRDYLTESQHYLVIGTSGLDDDLLALLSQSVRKVRTVHYVSDSSKGVRQLEGRFCRKIRGFASARNPVLFDSGFRAYVGSPMFTKLLKGLTT
jgi:hypothetical protein